MSPLARSDATPPVRLSQRRLPLRWLGLLTVAVVVGAALVFSTGGGSATSRSASPSSWAEVQARAKGSTVRLWMWGGEEALNRYIDEDVTPQARQAGVRLVRVPIEDTAAALSRIAAEHDAGVESGSVDLLWVNGKNFAQGKASGLWLKGWTDRLPSARFLDPSDPTLQTDFGVPVDGQELPWARAAFVFGYDSARLSAPPTTFDELVTFVRAHPGRFTYPSPPDFTGSAFVRFAVQRLGEEEAFRLLAEIEPLLWRGGRDHPRDSAALDQLFSDGQVDLTMSYNPSFLDAGVATGRFPSSVRPFVLDGASLQNVSFLAIPANTSSPEGAQVVADLLLSPEMQARKEARVGIPTVLDRTRLGAAATPFDRITPSPLRLTELGVGLEELPTDRVPDLDRRWLQDIAR